MKKKIFIFIIVVACSLGIAYGTHLIRRSMIWSDFMVKYSEQETKEFIHENALIKIYSNEEDLENLELVQNENVDLETIKNDNKVASDIIGDLVVSLRKAQKTSEKNISNNESIEFGLKNNEDGSYLYIYKNGTALLYKNEKYYVYKINNIESLKEEYQKQIKNISEEDPYFQLEDNIK